MKYVAIDAQEYKSEIDYPVFLLPLDGMREKIEDIKKVIPEMIEIEKVLPASVINTWITGGLNEEEFVFNEDGVYSVVDYNEDDVDTHDDITIRLSIEGEELLVSFYLEINGGEVYTDDFRFSEIEEMFSDKPEQYIYLYEFPSGDETVIKAKKISAELIDMLEVKMKELENNSVEKVSKLSWVSWTANVLHMAAFNAVIAAQMAVVKFLTWKD